MDKKNNNKFIISIILFIAVLIFSIFILYQENNNELVDNQSDNGIILFYGEGCPHCVIVENYIKENNIQNKISFIQKEVYNNQENAKDLQNKAKLCGLSPDSIGVPLLWDGKNCLIGDQDIINFFEQKINQ
ncbi:MAG: hypothetical protein PHO31_01545 [Candidatus Pacebacteria bacterium]|nr:hypothetical protein [Candidatus Paceibacterota bacterium]